MITSCWCCDIKDLNYFVANALPNEKFIYYSGYLEEHLLGRALGKDIYNMAVKGLVYLVRSRSARYIGFDYYMIKASKKPVIKLVPFTEAKLAEMGRGK